MEASPLWSRSTLALEPSGHPRSPNARELRGAAGSCGCSLSEARPAGLGRCSAGPPPPPQPLPRRRGDRACVRACARGRGEPPGARPDAVGRGGDWTVGEVCRADGRSGEGVRAPKRGLVASAGPARCRRVGVLRERRRSVRARGADSCPPGPGPAPPRCLLHRVP